MYTGAVTEDAPTPIPPINLNIKKLYQFVEKPEPSEATRYVQAIRIRVFFLPNLSEGILPVNAPMIVPI